MDVDRFSGKIANFLLSLVSPERCVICGKELWLEPVPLCRGCADLLAGRPIGPGKTCSVCSAPLVSEQETCSRCREREFNFDRSISAFLYEPHVRDLLWAYKFGNCPALSRFLAEQAGLILESWFPGLPVVPVPGRRGNIRRRGWDQVDRIARVLSRKRHIEIIRVLRRHRSVSQKTLSRAERQSNLSGKISLRKVKQYTIPEVVVLLDDVFTTGSTLSECALVLKNRGVRKVYAVTIAMEE